MKLNIGIFNKNHHRYEPGSYSEEDPEPDPTLGTQGGKSRLIYNLCDTQGH